MIADEKKVSQRRRAMKRWLRARGVPYKSYEVHNEAALRKLVRESAAPRIVNRTSSEE